MVCNTIRSSRCDVCCLQETKWGVLDREHVARTLPTFFEKDCAILDAIGSSGGCLIAWKKCYTPLNCWSSRHTVSVILRQNNTGSTFVVTNVYGPTQDDLKQPFLEELRFISTLICHPWMLTGDFNQVRWLTNRSSDMRGISQMCSFNDLIRDLEILDIPLVNRAFTWSSKRPKPIFSRLDRTFLSTDWNLSFPKIELEALEMVVSDHVPLLLTCKKPATKPCPIRMESFLLDYEEVGIKIKEIWSNVNPISNGMQTFHSNVTQLHSHLRAWHREKFGKVSHRLELCRTAILLLDKEEESRQLNEVEFKLRLELRAKAFKLASI